MGGWAIFFSPVFHFNVGGSAVEWHRQRRKPASQPSRDSPPTSSPLRPLPPPPPPPPVLPGTRDGALSQCELHQDDEHRRENKLPSTLWSSRRGALRCAALRYQPLTAEHGSLLMESLMRCSARRCRSHADRAEIKGSAKSLPVKTRHENELIARARICVQGARALLCHTRRSRG